MGGTIEAGDRFCILTQMDMVEGEIVDQCMQCKKVYTTSELNKWEGNCPNCGGDRRNFIRGAMGPVSQE